MKKRILIFLFFCCGAAKLSAQTLPVVGTVPGNQTSNIVSGSLTDSDGLQIQNTGTVPLRFCMANNASATCVGSPTSIPVNAGATVNVTVADLGGISSGTFLNVSNESLALGTFTVSRVQPGGGNAGNCLSPAPGAWQTIPNQLNNFTLFLCPGYTTVGIGTTSPAATLHVKGTQRVDGSTLNNGDVSVNEGTLTITSTGSIDRIALNRISSSSQRSRIAFRHNGAERWALGTDFQENNSNNFFISRAGSFIPPFFVSSAGHVGINTNKPDPNFALSVNGRIRAKKVILETTWADYVFEEGYKLVPLKELEQYIKQHKHLPEIPSATEVETNGADVNELLKKQMQKIEELTLYVIELNKKIEELQNQKK
jgi:hypothetical protein